MKEYVSSEDDHEFSKFCSVKEGEEERKKIKKGFTVTGNRL